ncbi:methyltransferase domain-containing protein [Streptomyces sp. 8K308]|uniref:methyltransferase domain-containing protein n=1 Tax=Streptomyces sp. 8K308 TaxID=2530388 RepID=UPI001050768F|nr:methyltransferase domain-containing protein [Streptomyces sp. 8K308]TDC15998.1 methyltransferase domain-containing protein [Streptomyces sp. 8K308]
MTSRAGALAAAAFAVPRHHFIPPRAWAWPTAGSEGHWIDRERDADRWWSAVSSDTVIVTQIDDGETELTEEAVRKTFTYTCSSSGPSLVFAFLDLLDPGPGHRVLDVGTGTGWTAGLLSHLVGEENVTSVEVDQTLLTTAEKNLARAGVSPRLVLGDAAEGAPAGGPFDRVHVTCGVYDIPHDWIARTRPGGTIVLPWSRNHRIVHLTVGDDGTAAGRFHDSCAFMPLRGQRPARIGGLPDDERERAVTTDVRRILDLTPGWEVYLAAVVGDIPAVVRKGQDHVLAILSEGASHARLETKGSGGTVTQRGPRNLWDEVERAHLAWTAAGAPGIDRFGLTVTQDRQDVWLDSPARTVNPQVREGR